MDLPSPHAGALGRLASLLAVGSTSTALIDAALGDRVLSALLGGGLAILGGAVLEYARPWLRSASEQRLARRARRASLHGARRRPGRVALLVDDQLPGEFLASALPGWTVEACTTLAGAVDHLRSRPPPDVVLLDLRLEAHDPSDVVTAIRALYSGRLVLISGDDRVESYAARVGAEAIRKPLTATELRERLSAPPQPVRPSTRPPHAG